MSRTSSQKVNAELFSLEPTALLEFFVIYYDYVNSPEEKLYIHGGTNGINNSIYWQGVEYLPFPIQSSGFETKGDGSLPRPKLMVSNQDFFVSNLIRRYSNLIGAKVVRKRTFLKFLDNRNFSDNKNPYGSADANAGLEDQVFFILRRASENRAIVEFELASPLELDGVTFPKRTVMARYCPFHYRGNGCRYTGGPVADENNNRLTKATVFSNGLIRKRYTPASGDTGSSSAPANQDQATSKIQAATYAAGSLQALTSPFVMDTIADYYYEYIGYFYVGKGEAGEYTFGVSPDDGADMFVKGILVSGDYGSGNQQALPEEGTYSKISLSEGYNRVLIRYWQKSNSGTSTAALKIYYKPPTTSISPSWVEVPSNKFYYDKAELTMLESKLLQRFFSLNLETVIALDNSSLNKTRNRSLWRNGADYNVGEFVYIENSNIKVAKADVNDSPNWTPLQKFYLCTKSHKASASKHPSINKEYWVCDQCSKTLDGCKIRFDGQDYLPFGGFPGTEEYQINGQ